jgi:hypothetical protein
MAYRLKPPPGFDRLHICEGDVISRNIVPGKLIDMPGELTETNAESFRRLSMCRGITNEGEQLTPGAFLYKAAAEDGSDVLITAMETSEYCRSDPAPKDVCSRCAFREKQIIVRLGPYTEQGES